LATAPNAALTIRTLRQLTALHDFVDSVGLLMAMPVERGARATYTVTATPPIGRIAPTAKRQIDGASDFMNFAWGDLYTAPLTSPEQLAPMLLVADSALLIAARSGAPTSGTIDTVAVERLLARARQPGSRKRGARRRSRPRTPGPALTDR